MAKLADESQVFESHTVAGLLRSAPDLVPNINNVESMFQPTTEECVYYYIFESIVLFDWLSDPDELTPRPGKDERFDEVGEEIETRQRQQR